MGNCVEISWKLITPSAAIIHQADVWLLVVTDVSGAKNPTRAAFTVLSPAAPIDLAFN